MNIISIDLPWNPGKKGRRVLAISDACGRVSIETAECQTELENKIIANSEPDSLILLDIPINGCDALSDEQPYRPLDIALARCGIFILPSKNAKRLGSEMKARLKKARQNVHVYESYPYAVYKFLAYVERTTNLNNLKSSSRETLLDSEFKRSSSDWPPKYKRQKGPDRQQKLRGALEDVYMLLIHIGLTFDPPLPKARDLSLTVVELADRYDACLGLIPGLHLARTSPYWYLAGNQESGGILILADQWLKDRFESSLNEVMALKEKV